MLPDGSMQRPIACGECGTYYPPGFPKPIHPHGSPVTCPSHPEVLVGEGGCDECVDAAMLAAAESREGEDSLAMQDMTRAEDMK